MDNIDSKIRYKCPRCGNLNLRNWQQLNGEEQEIVKRLPASALNTIKERIALHLWCTKCWFESQDKEANEA